MVYRPSFAFAAFMMLTACASSAPSVPSQSATPLRAAPLMGDVGDAPVVTASKPIARTNPVAAVKALTRGDDIKVKAPVPVLSATMPDDAAEK